MAEAIFEEHPLEQYLRGQSSQALELPRIYREAHHSPQTDAGEVHELMPGTSLELIREIDIDRHLYQDLQEGDDSYLEGSEMEWRPPCLIVGLNVSRWRPSRGRRNANLDPLGPRILPLFCETIESMQPLRRALQVQRHLVVAPRHLPISSQFTPLLAGVNTRETEP